ncbi:MAG: NTP transferase domain-containing protein, partial [Candidatus Thorarchaeota archaeon]
MRAIILAAGRGSRIGPLTKHIPKALLECGGQTLIERTINSYIESGIDNITVGVGWNGHEVRKHIEQAFPNETIRIIDVPNYMHGPLQTLFTSLESNNEPCIIGPVDSLVDSHIISELMESYKLQSSDLVIAIDVEAARGTDVYINESRCISGLGSKKDGKYLGKSVMLVAASS